MSNFSRLNRLAVITVSLCLAVQVIDAEDSELAITSTSNEDSILSISFLIEQLENVSSVFELSVQLDSWLLDHELSDLVALFEQSKAISNLENRTDIQQRIVERIASIDPKRALKIAETQPNNYKRVLYSAIFREWVFMDIDSAVEYAASTLPQNIKRLMVQSIVSIRDDLDESTRLKLAKRLGMEQVASALLDQSRINVLLDQPELALKAVLDDGKPDRDQIGSLVQIALVWIEKEGIEVLDSIGDQLPFGTRRNLLQAVFAQLTQRDAQKAFQSAISILDQTDSIVISNVLRNWASWDAPAAMEATQTVESDEFRNSLQAKLIQDWSIANPFELLDSLDLVPEPLRKTAESQAIQFVSMIAPAKAATHVAETAGQNFNDVKTFISGWAMRDPEGAVEWILGSSNFSDRRWELLNPILPRVSIEYADKFFDVLKAQPLNSSGAGGEVDIIRWVLNHDVDTALELLPKARAGLTKIMSYEQVGRKLAELDRNSEAIALANNLSVDHRKTYIRSLALQWVANDSSSAMDLLRLLSTESDRSSFAFSLISSHKIQQFLTDTQNEQLEGLLIPEDAEDLAEEPSFQ